VATLKNKDVAGKNEHSIQETPHLLVKLLRRSLLGRVARLRVLLLRVLLRVALLCA
jgi:hypothetical protein